MKIQLITTYSADDINGYHNLLSSERAKFSSTTCRYHTSKMPLHPKSYSLKLSWVGTSLQHASV